MGGWSTPFRRALSPLGSRAASAAEVRRLSCASAAKAGFSSDDVAAVRLNRLRKNPWQWGKTADPSPLKRFGMTKTQEGFGMTNAHEPFGMTKTRDFAAQLKAAPFQNGSQSEFFSSLQ